MLIWRIRIEPHTVHLKPQQANSTRTARFISLSKISYINSLNVSTHTLWTTFRTNNLNETRSYSTSSTTSSLRFTTLFDLESRQNRSRSVCYEDQTIFVWQYWGFWKWAGLLNLRRSLPLSYNVKFGDQIYSRQASQLLNNQTGNQDLSENKQKNFWIEIHLWNTLQVKMYSNLKRKIKFQINFRGGNCQENSE